MQADQGRVSLSQRMGHAEAALIKLNDEFNQLRASLGDFETRFSAHVDGTTQSLRDLRELMEGAMETVTAIANTLTVDKPLVDEIRGFMADQRRARLEREAREKQLALDDSERRKDLRRAFSAIFVTIALGLASYIVKSLIPRFGDALMPLAIVAFTVVCLGFVGITFGKGFGKRAP